MARSAQFLRLTWRLFPGLPPSPKSSQQTLPRIPRHRAMWTVSSPIALAIRRQPLSRRGWPRRRALTPSRHRRVQICRPYAVQHELERPLIVLVSSLEKGKFHWGRVSRRNTTRPRKCIGCHMCNARFLTDIKGILTQFQSPTLVFFILPWWRWPNMNDMAS